MNKRGYAGAIVVIAGLFGINSVQAQENPSDKNAGRSDDRSPSRVFVRDSTTGSEIVGRLLQLGPDTVRLLVDGQEKELQLPDVLTIDREGDSLKNGALIGAVVAGAWCAIVCGQGLDSTSQLLPTIIGNAALGSLIGMGFDAQNRGRTNIYRNPRKASALTSALVVA